MDNAPSNREPEERRGISGSNALSERRGIGRRDVLQLGALLGIALPVAACGSGGDDGPGGPGGADGSGHTGATGGPDGVGSAGSGDPAEGENRSVIVVGAGPAGLSAAHLLARAGVEVTVLEAAPVYGGRVRRTLDLVDFPIPLGAEWLHAEPATLDRIADDDVDVELVRYGPEATLGYFDGVLTTEPLGEFGDLKFVGSSWFDFFEEHVVPGIAGSIRVDTAVTRIDATGDRVVVVDHRADRLEADAVVVTVPVAALRDRDITFVPDLSEQKWAAIDEITVWSGFKAFFEFDESFAPTFLAFPDSDTEAGQRLYYDAAYGQDTDAHVVGLFAVGAPAERYQTLGGDALRDRVLEELDEVFDGAASRSYRQHIAQDWNAEPFIRQGYVSDHADARLVRALGEPASDRVLFAGDAYSDGEDWSSVHVAAASARVAVERILELG